MGYGYFVNKIQITKEYMSKYPVNHTKGLNLRIRKQWKGECYAKARASTLQVSAWVQKGDAREWSSQELVDFYGWNGGPRGFDYEMKNGLSLESTNPHVESILCVLKYYRKLKSALHESGCFLFSTARKMLNIERKDRIQVIDIVEVEQTEQEFLNALRDNALLVGIRYYSNMVKYLREGGIFTNEMFYRLKDELEEGLPAEYKRLMEEKRLDGFIPNLFGRHALVAVEYGVEDGVAYVKCVNSEGPDFGGPERGHIRIEVLCEGPKKPIFGVLFLYLLASYPIIG